MQVPPVITFRHMASSSAIEDHAMRRIEALDQSFPRLVGCQVVIDAPQKKHQSGREFEISVSVQLPGQDVHAREHIGRSTAPEDVSLALHRAFDAVERKLRERFERMGHVETKQHLETGHGVIDRLFEGEGYGFIAGTDGVEYYFQRDSLTSGDWSELKVGMRLRFKAMDGDKGPFAVAVSTA